MRSVISIDFCPCGFVDMLQVSAFINPNTNGIDVEWECCKKPASRLT